MDLKYCVSVWTGFSCLYMKFSTSFYWIYTLGSNTNELLLFVSECKGLHITRSDFASRHGTSVVVALI
jgi:hypothetical protein